MPLLHDRLIRLGERATHVFSAREGGLALGHNGNLINTPELAALLPADRLSATTDTEVLTRLLAAAPHRTTEEAALDVLPKVKGAFSLVFMDEHTLYAARDPRESARWSWAGSTAGGSSPARPRRWTSSALPCARGRTGRAAGHQRGRRRFPGFRPGRAQRLPVRIRLLARPDTTIAGRKVNSARVEVGRRLARQHPADADVVIPVPESGTPAAVGYAESSGIPFAQGW